MALSQGFFCGIFFYVQFQMFNHENKSFTVALVRSDGDKQPVPGNDSLLNVCPVTVLVSGNISAEQPEQSGPRCVAQRREVKNIMLVLSPCDHSGLTRGGKRVVF